MNALTMATARTMMSRVLGDAGAAPALAIPAFDTDECPEDAVMDRLRVLTSEPQCALT